MTKRRQREPHKLPAYRCTHDAESHSILHFLKIFKDSWPTFKLERFNTEFQVFSFFWKMRSSNWAYFPLWRQERYPVPVGTGVWDHWYGRITPPNLWRRYLLAEQESDYRFIIQISACTVIPNISLLSHKRTLFL